ncbi:MAG: HigA family addiction module antidote protein [Bacteroidales bacterium]|nr:HigA family addiction module antidote protein [Bacteroidales bacterium]
METRNKVVPFMAVAPGVTIKEELEARNIKQKDFAKKINMQAPHLSELLKGKRPISTNVADALERELGISAKFWLRLQAEYDYDCEAIRKRGIEEEKARMFINEYNEIFDVDYVLKRIGIFASSYMEKVNVLTTELNLPKPAELKYAFGKFHKSNRVGTDRRAILTWTILAEYYARQQQVTKSYSADDNDFIGKLAEVFHENHNVIERTKQILSDNGIRFCIVEKLDKASIDGYSFIDTDGTPSIVVTKRIDRIDNFAFAVMHEIGHLKLHASLTDKKFINLSEDAKEEQEANNFASQQLIPNHLWKSNGLPQVALNKPWVIQNKYSQWATENHLNKWIVLGRISYETGMHKFKNDESRKIN